MLYFSIQFCKTKLCVVAIRACMFRVVQLWLLHAFCFIGKFETSGLHIKERGKEIFSDKPSLGIGCYTSKKETVQNATVSFIFRFFKLSQLLNITDSR